MALDHLGSTARMGPVLLRMVEHQLLADLSHYGLSRLDLRIDWSEACQEGHCTTLLDGNLEALSNLAIRTTDGLIVATGWFDFVHGGGNNPLFAFWLLLSDSSGRQIKSQPTIPGHIWQALPESSKRLCARQGTYDSCWSGDPLVDSWRREHAA